MRTFFIVFAFLVATLVGIFGYRGITTDRRPIEIFPDMDRQPRYESQGESAFFSDGRADREPVRGTVARGQLREDDHRYRGRENGEYTAGFPMEITASLMSRGRERYGIFCSACHGGTGDGQGITSNYGMVATPTFHSDRQRNMTEGEIYDVIANGRGLMGPYAGKISVDDRWAIVAYVRALQRARTGSIDDVPAEKRGDLGL